jgi:membrane protein implicated in regulation of membrane protease activity
MQSKYHSLIEAGAGTFIGYWINIGVAMIAYPLYGATFTLQQNIELGIIFLLVSLVRGYVIRRFFNKKAKHV